MPSASFIRGSDSVSLDIALALDGNRSQGSGIDTGSDAFPGGGAEIDAALSAVSGEPRGDIHRIAPDVEAELLSADNAGNDRAHVDADAATIRS